MIQRRSDGAVYYEFDRLALFPGLRHAAFTRLGGVSLAPFATLNVGHLVGDDPAAVQANEERVFSILGVQALDVVTPRQVHGAHVQRVARGDGATVIPSTDGLITDEPRVALFLRFADCVPVLLFDSRRRAVALVHAGWRGWAAGVVINALRVMRDEFGTWPGDLSAGIGPAIGPCCYPVGPEVIVAVEGALGADSQVLSRQPSGATHLDLPGAVRIQLERCGVREVEDSGMCTSCSNEQFFSHRAEHGRTGRFAVVVVLD